MQGKSQTATEYLIILAVVIVIALIVIGVLGGIPSIGGGASRTSQLAALKTQNVGVDNFYINSTNAKIKLKNNLADTIRLNYIKVNGYYVNYTASNTMRAGETKLLELTGSFVDFSDGKQVPDIEVTYVDVATNAVYTTEGLAGEKTGIATSDGVDDEIESGINSNTGLIEWELNGKIHSTTYGLYGSSSGSDDSRCYMNLGAWNGKYGITSVDCTNSGASPTQSAVDADTDYHSLKFIELDGVYLDGTKIISETTPARGGANLFFNNDLNDDGSPVYSVYSLKYSKVWIDGELVRFLVPQPDGTILDLVNGVKYCNKGNCAGDQLTVSVI